MGHAKGKEIKKKKKKKETKAILPFWRAEETSEPFLAILCEFQRQQDTEKESASAWEVQFEWRDREKHIESVREWKRKMRHFSLLELHTRKINWRSSHEVFECYNHGELEYSEEDFAIGFVVRLYLLFEIYLLYIQFIMYSSLC